MGKDYLGVGCPDFSVHGESPWYPQYEAYRRQLGFYYSGKFAEDADIYLMFNMHWEPHAFSLPHTDGLWRLAVDTSAEEQNGIFEGPEAREDQDTFELNARSVVVLVSDGVKKEGTAPKEGACERTEAAREESVCEKTIQSMQKSKK